jgi:hypothetical protein
MSRNTNRAAAVALLLPVIAFMWPATLPAADVTPATGGGVITPAGQPEDYKEGKHAIYALWFEDGSWNIRATARPGAREKFSGEIKIVKGKIVSGEYQGLEVAAPGKKAKTKKPKNTDLIWLAEDHRTLRFELNSIGKSDSFSFKVNPAATEIEFRLLFNDSESRERIYIGKAGQHPEKIPFILKANP